MIRERYLYELIFLICEKSRLINLFVCNETLVKDVMFIMQMYINIVIIILWESIPILFKWVFW